MRNRELVLSIVAVVCGLLPAVASAHAFGQQYTLPLPFSLYAIGAAGALIASFLVLALYSEPTTSTGRLPEKIVHSGSRKFEWTLRIVGLLGFVFTLLCAFIGPNDFALNPTPILFWVVLLLGMTYLGAFVGGLWAFLNPFDTIVRIIFLGKIPQPIFRYPTWLGYAPAGVLYFTIIYLELLSNGLGSLPIVIGVVLLWYAFISCSGAILFGPEMWFKYGDFFSVFFKMLGLFAPIHIEDKRIVLQIPGERLVTEQADKLGILIFILFMLSSTAFDGLHETKIWWSTLYASAWQLQIHEFEEFFALLVSPFVFLTFYGAAVYAMKVLGDSRKSYRELLLRFAYSLIPIAIAYNFAHYFTLLMYQLEALAPMLADPFGRGWQLLGAITQHTSVVLLDARIVWYTQFGVILVGHVVATYIAHRIATREFDTKKGVIIGQLPVLLLMVFYTVFGLWILSQAYQNG